MYRFRDCILTAAGFAVLAMTVGAFTAGHAIAQAVRAALVSNVDEPGRIPYRAEISISGNCAIYCEGTSHPVPAGKRLVITNVTGQVYSSVPAGTEIVLAVQNGLDSGSKIPMIYSGQRNGQNSFGFNQQVLIFFDAGFTPSAFVFTAASAPTNGLVDVSGYLLDCTAAPCAALFNN